MKNFVIEYVDTEVLSNAQILRRLRNGLKVTMRHQTISGNMQHN